MDFPVVGIGASAGGLDACTKLIGTLPTEMAYILVQHLDPTHESMMAGLLASHTAMPVLEAVDGTAIERGHFYVIPPGSYLSIAGGSLRLSQPDARHGQRMPFDFLLKSLAKECSRNAVCIVLSGNGGDGSEGVKAIREHGGFVIAQQPDEAGSDGMPRSAIQTGFVDAVLGLEEMRATLSSLLQGSAHPRATAQSPATPAAADFFRQIIELLRDRTEQDFTSYKPGTLQRRIERRMVLASVEDGHMDRYLDMLRGDPVELDLLAKDLLINVTSFFRDRKVFDLLAEKIIPEIVSGHSGDQPLRIWIAGCSTGEETYSLAMLFHEQINAAKRAIKLQVFASDVDPDAITEARNGFYMEAMVASVSTERLARFFSKEDHGYRIAPELRSCVVFTVQDVLADPPFSRLDLVSCRNLLIYLRPAAQAKVIALFHFALREGGVLLLGSSETVGNVESHFTVISKAERLYRRAGQSLPGEFGAAKLAGDGMRAPFRAGPSALHSRQAVLADTCRRLVLDAFAPAAVLINERHECLYFLGPTDKYLKVAPGYPIHDLLAMAREDVRGKLRSAIQRSARDQTNVVVPVAGTGRDGAITPFSIAVRPVLHEGEKLQLICFVDAPESAPRPDHPVPPEAVSRIEELEQELETTRLELRAAARSLEESNEEQRAVNEEALSVNEEYQSTNEELLTSKEELQSLNEELTALNNQLHETLERQRTTFDDLQNILYSTDVATLFLDKKLNIRFFTPATKALFNIIPGDIGRPLADLNALSADSALPSDVRAVLDSLEPVEREIEAQNSIWFSRRISPYYTRDNAVEGVVITFTDVTDRKVAGKALEAARQRADQANAAKSRFLAAASHDLRQPLQTLSLLEGLLAKSVTGERALELVGRFEQTLAAMTGMLNSMLDINHIEAGITRAEVVSFPVNDILERLRDEFVYHAQAQELALRMVPCSLCVNSDPRLLEQMIRNLISNALKYTNRGKVLLGCRRRKGMLSIEVWDTGVGISDSEHQAIFEEYYQIDNEARERKRGLGLGLAIVRRLGDLLGHKVGVRSQPRRGSGFSIEVALADDPAARLKGHRSLRIPDGIIVPKLGSSTVLIIEDDPAVRGLLELLFREEGHVVISASDGLSALQSVGEHSETPHLILADYNLPNGMNGIEVSQRLRKKLRRAVPVIILTGDISGATQQDIAAHDCVQLNKPVKLVELTQSVERLLAASLQPAVERAPPAVEEFRPRSGSLVYVVDDNTHVCESIRAVLEDIGLKVESFASCETFLKSYRPGADACLLIDAYLPGMSGLELLQHLNMEGHRLPSIMITGHSDVPIAVEAMKAGALDFIEKPISRNELLAGVDRALRMANDGNEQAEWRQKAIQLVAGLTQRQREIMALVLEGQPSKNIAADLGISQRTVENHRAAIMTRMGAKSLPQLARLALAAQ